jgi:predicted GIY-YIG superfamily endonuclease
MAFWVYMLRCADRSYYVGHTDNLEIRFGQHESGAIPGWTHSRRPVVMVFSDSFSSRDEALAAERQIKGWSRAKKEALIVGDWSRISELARRRLRGQGA